MKAAADRQTDSPALCSSTGQGASSGLHDDATSSHRGTSRSHTASCPCQRAAPLQSHHANTLESVSIMSSAPTCRLHSLSSLASPRWSAAVPASLTCQQDLLVTSRQVRLDHPIQNQQSPTQHWDTVTGLCYFSKQNTYNDNIHTDSCNSDLCVTSVVVSQDQTHWWLCRRLDEGVNSDSSSREDPG